jgi:hypothetical protein
MPPRQISSPLKEMNASDASSVVSADRLRVALASRLFPDEEGLNTYAVLDGASAPDLLDHLYDDPRPEFVCLYRGELEPDLAEVGPYLIRLQPDAPFTDWLLNEGWGKHWGIYAITPADLNSMRKHFRTFLMVKMPNGSRVYFRFYDPRVFAAYLPTCNPFELQHVFGPVTEYVFEHAESRALLRFSRDETGGRLVGEELLKQ